MKTLITGASGLVGRALAAHLRGEGWEVIPLVRSVAPGAQAGWVWNPETGEVDGRLDGGVDAVVHLAGENLAARRWTKRHKARIRASRVRGTGAIAEAVAGASRKPRVVIGASATGFYGSRGEHTCTEDTAPGGGFLAEVCQAWEEAWSPVEQAGVRLVRLRIGMVLAAEGGALARMLPLFRLGLGGVLGSGRQYWSWVHLDDLVRIVARTIQDTGLSGAVNAVSPEPVTNRVFTRELASVLARPAWLRVPGWGLRGLVGEMADEALLGGARVLPEKLVRRGFGFAHPNLRGALQDLVLPTGG